MDYYTLLLAQHMIDERIAEARQAALARQARPAGGPPGRLTALLGALRRRRRSTARPPTSQAPRKGQAPLSSRTCTSTCSTR